MHLGCIWTWPDVGNDTHDHDRWIWEEFLGIIFPFVYRFRTLICNRVALLFLLHPVNAIKNINNLKSEHPKSSHLSYTLYCIII